MTYTPPVHVNVSAKAIALDKIHLVFIMITLFHILLYIFYIYFVCIIYSSLQLFEQINIA